MMEFNILMHQVTVRLLPGGSAVEGALFFRGEGGGNFLVGLPFLLGVPI